MSADHPLRAALVALLEETGTLTANEAARRLGESSGACSFHLRQLARHRTIEPAPGGRGREKPWRLCAAGPEHDTGELDLLNRELEDEGYRRWLAHRDSAPARWRRDAAFSDVLWLTPAEFDEIEGELRAIVGRYRERAGAPARRPRGARPVASVTRLFPLLPAGDS